ncbi:neutral zinc metallopeptidase [Planomonospora sp. ID91781]|uniref:Metalloprotease n=1 Tax=Planomonospora sphaerica TaxID=161355 RepID=A0A171C4M2_9ACTN|nr:MULTISPECIES: neutral zinc metallopeptidase [Planomonospora]MBG0824431.1 neutral zinc metallopeptidase [Planomonospora sp. ID91781]GAT66104.1 metalloprotease [Planomonospora sphaerica]
MSALPLGHLSSLVTAALSFSLAAGAGQAGAIPVAAAQAPAAPAGTALVQGRAAATANPLYAAGVLPSVACPAGSIKAGSAASYKAFMTRVARCLGLAWGIQFGKAGLDFTPPELRFATSRVSSPCGKWPAGAGGYYCSSDRTIYIGLTRAVLKNPYGPNHAQFMAHEYAHHVQQLAGILPYYGRAVWRAGTSARLALSRRLELQADCLASAFLRGAAGDLEVTPEHWEAMLEWTARNGHKSWPKNDHGRGSSQAYWMERGFERGAPRACNTFTAPRRVVD